MSLPILVDTSYIIGLLNSRDGLHEKCDSLSYLIKKRILIFTDYVISEASAGLAHPKNRKMFIKFLENQKKSNQHFIFFTESNIFDRALEYYAHHLDKQWSLTDCILAVHLIANKTNLILSSDHHFEQMGFIPLLNDRIYSNADGYLKNSNK